MHQPVVLATAAVLDLALDTANSELASCSPFGFGGLGSSGMASHLNLNTADLENSNGMLNNFQVTNATPKASSNKIYHPSLQISQLVSLPLSKYISTSLPGSQFKQPLTVKKLVSSSLHSHSATKKFLRSVTFHDENKTSDRFLVQKQLGPVSTNLTTRKAISQFIVHKTIQWCVGVGCNWE